MRKISIKDRNAAEEWLKQWRIRENALERIHREEIKRADTEHAILSLEDAFQDAIQKNAIRRDSGLVEMRRWFDRLSRF